MSVLQSNIADHPCYHRTAEGFDYLEYSCVSGTEFLYSSFEKNYDGYHVFQFIEKYTLVPILSCIAYLTLIHVGQDYFKTRERWNWRLTMAAWNTLLCVFSAVGFLRTAPQLLHNLSTYAVRDNLCLEPRSTYGSGSTGLWIQLFCLSKFPELLDTFFIVIHKKKLIFLHWYHHVTVLLYCWHSYATKSPSGIVFAVMNYAVHSVMYGYYALMALRVKPKWFNPIVITIFQISQMAVGVAVTIMAFHYYWTDSDCKISAENNLAAFCMYGSYLFLFMQFFIGRYFKPSGASSTGSSPARGTSKKSKAL